MGRSEILAFFIIACVLAISLQQAYALKCWTCSSDNWKARSQFCGETLDESKISNEDRDLSYRECWARPNQIAYCRKITKYVGNTLVYARTCYGKPANAPGSQCYDDEQAVSYVRYLNCELCRTDGCNAPKNITNDAPSNLSTNGPSNVPTNAPNNVPPTNPPNNSPPTNAPTNAPTNNPNTDKKGDSSDATQFGPIALFCIIPVAVARSFLHQ